jgi:hypothetical protein
MLIKKWSYKITNYGLAKYITQDSESGFDIWVHLASIGNKVILNLPLKKIIKAIFVGKVCLESGKLALMPA